MPGYFVNAFTFPYLGERAEAAVGRKKAEEEDTRVAVIPSRSHTDVQDTHVGAT